MYKRQDLASVHHGDTRYFLLLTWCYGVELQKAALGERKRLGTGDDEVVEDFHIDQRQRRFEFPRQQLVGTTRFADATRMVMREDGTAGVHRQCSLNHLARIHRGLRQGAAKQFFAAQDLSLIHI